MSNNWLENNVTSLEDSKRLAENNIELGEADGYWIYLETGYDIKTGAYVITSSEDNYPTKFLDDERKLWDTSCNPRPYNRHCKAYRLDKLLAEMPEPYLDYDGINFNFLTDDCGNKSYEHAGLDWEVESHIRSLVSGAFLSKGKEAIKACVDLLILLKAHAVQEGIK